jgi:hypothetical protein
MPPPHNPTPPRPATPPPSVGRTARAGRSGRSVTVVTQYDVEMFQKIEHLTGVKMEQFPADREEVLLLLEQVGWVGWGASGRPGPAPRCRAPLAGGLRRLQTGLAGLRARARLGALDRDEAAWRTIVEGRAWAQLAGLHLGRLAHAHAPARNRAARTSRR